MMHRITLIISIIISSIAMSSATDLDWASTVYVKPDAVAGVKLPAVNLNGNGFSIPFSKATGLIDHATVNGETAIESGPQLNVYVNYNHLTGAEVRKIADHLVLDTTTWKVKAIAHSRTAQGVKVAVEGTYNDVEVAIDYVITPAGEISIGYTANGLPNGYVRELGLCFDLPQNYSWLKWQRRGYWDSYPEHSMSGNTGDAHIYDSHQSAYGEKPTQPWAYDTHNYYYWSDAGANCSHPLTNMAKAMKENVLFYTIKSNGQDPHGISVVSANAEIACRLNKAPTDRLQLIVDNKWDYPEIAWGNYCKMQDAAPYHGFIKIVMH